MRSRSKIPVAPVHEPLYRKADFLHEIIRKGLILDSPDIVTSLQPDGRIQLKLARPRLVIAALGGAPGPGSAGIFSDFYCQAGGSNLNAGSDQNNAAKYTSTNGGYNATTDVFTPTDGSNPVSAGVAVGDFASVYLDGSSVTAYIARVTAVVNAVNGAITISAVVVAGVEPTTSAAGRTIKVGGAWKGFNAASGFPVTLTNLGRLLYLAGGGAVRVNLKNDATYSVTSQITVNASQSDVFTLQGYSSQVGDGGKAVVDGGTSVATVFSSSSSITLPVVDIEFKSSFTTGTNNLVILSNRWMAYRCVFHGARGAGLFAASFGIAIECEVYDCNRSNSANVGGVNITSAGVTCLRCYVHDCPGSNVSGFSLTGGPAQLIHCIVDTVGGHGVLATTVHAPFLIHNCDFYNVGGDGLNFTFNAQYALQIESCNFVGCAGRGINIGSAGANGYVYNCGYSNNGAANILGVVTEIDPFDWADSNPWTNPAGGNFTNSGLGAGAGRGAFTEIGPGVSGTVGTPNIGAA